MISAVLHASLMPLLGQRANLSISNEKRSSSGKVQYKLVVLGKLQQLGVLGLKRTVGFSGSAVAGIRAGELDSSH